MNTDPYNAALEQAHLLANKNQRPVFVCVSARTSQHYLLDRSDLVSRLLNGTTPNIVSTVFPEGQQGA